MSPVPSRFDGLRRRGILVAYAPIGDPRFDAPAVLDLYQRVGVDVVEVCVPTLDPYLDGPTIAHSLRLGFEAGADAKIAALVIESWRSQRSSGPLVVLVSYPGTLPGDFDWATIDALDGLLLIDEHLADPDGAARSELAQRNISRCAFLRWNPSEQALRTAVDADGYVMAQSRPGMTGTGRPDPQSSATVAELRSLGCQSPVVFGFGVNDDDAIWRAASYGADGVVIGSACLEALTKGFDTAAQFLTKTRHAVDEAFVGNKTLMAARENHGQ